MLSTTLAVDCPPPNEPERRVEGSVSGLQFRRTTDAPSGIHGGVTLSAVDERAALLCEARTPTQPSSERSVYRAGDVIARKYRLRAVIGEGGMGTVWAARNEDLQLDVAIKLVHRHLNVEDTRRRLLAEARAEARIDHPGVVRVLDVGATCGDSFLVMELLQGSSLGKLLRKTGRLTPAVAVKILLPVIDALAHAHEKGVVHRDLKPDNIFLADSGGRLQPKVVDFGIAQVSEREPSTTPTHPRAIAGTPGYMAPEQECGGDVDGRADVWALSLVLYEALTGKSTFAASSYDATPRVVAERKLLPTTELGIGDAGLWQILEHGLQKDRMLRLPSMRAMGRALGEWLVEHGETTDITGESVADIWLALRPEKLCPVIVPRRRRAGHWAVVGLAIAASLAMTSAPDIRISQRVGAGAVMPSAHSAPGLSRP
jgi:serine/threonine-protein kinase